MDQSSKRLAFVILFDLEHLDYIFTQVLLVVGEYHDTYLECNLVFLYLVSCVVIINSLSHPVFPPESGCDSIGIRAKIMPPRMTTRSAGRSTTAPRGRGIGERVDRGAKRNREPVRRNNGIIGELDGQGNDRGVGANRGVDGVLDFFLTSLSTIAGNIPTLSQVGSQGSNQGKMFESKRDAVNDNYPGDVRKSIANKDRRGCTYKEFLACYPKEYDGKGRARVYTR
ncbi:hypothetical protein Tco_1506009 [Tanacetum coccineum]